MKTNMTNKIVLGITGASGACYAKAMVEALVAPTQDTREVQPRAALAAVLSRSAPEVWRHEIGGDLREWLTAQDIPVFDGRDYRAPFASGSAGWEAMAIVPCSMSTVAKVAHGISDDLLSRAADVMLKERRKLILVARETPLSTIHLENMLTVTRAGAIVLPAVPSFYGRPTTVDEVVATVVARILDHLGVDNAHTRRWGQDVVLGSASRERDDS
jgi:4-hydroxy-3-polyprenylbenzoate decarboxylase